jgi:hypothetical protein
MELGLPTPVSCPPSLEWRCTGAIHGKEGRIQVLAGLAPSSQTVGSLFRGIHEQAKRSLGTTEANKTLITWHQALSLSLTHFALMSFVLMSFVLMSLCANVTQPYTLSKIGAQNANDSNEWLYLSC